MIAQWENECISLSRPPCDPEVMIGQWENECIPLSALSIGLGHDSSVGEWMYPTVCPLSGPDSIPGRVGVFQEIFSGWSHSANLSWPAWQKMAQSPLNGTTKSGDIEEEGQCPTTTDIGRKEGYSGSSCCSEYFYVFSLSSLLHACP